MVGSGFGPIQNRGPSSRADAQKQNKRKENIFQPSEVDFLENLGLDRNEYIESKQ